MFICREQRQRPSAQQAHHSCRRHRDSQGAGGGGVRRGAAGGVDQRGRGARELFCHVTTSVLGKHNYNDDVTNFPSWNRSPNIFLIINDRFSAKTKFD